MKMLMTVRRGDRGNMIKKVKTWIFFLLIGRSEFIKKNYDSYVTRREKKNKIVMLWKIVQWNVSNLFFPEHSMRHYKRLKYPETENYLKRNKILPSSDRKADVVFIHLFQTLLLSSVENPDERFVLMGAELGIANYKRYRIQAEEEIKRQAQEGKDSYCLTDIHRLLEQWCGIPWERGIEVERKVEKGNYFINPRWSELVQGEQTENLEIIVMANERYPQDMLVELINHFQLNKEFIRVLSDKEEIERLESNYREKGKEIFFITENESTRIRQSGKKYRPNHMQGLLGSMYNTIVNTHYYANPQKRSIFYEFGFTCGGILAVGFCQWLNQLAREKGIDKFLFVARDGDLISKLYGKYFGTIDYCYLLFSRFASERLVFQDYIEEYIQHAVREELNGERRYTILTLLERLGITYGENFDFMGLDTQRELSGADYETVRNIFYQNREKIGKEFEKECIAAKQYFTECVGTSKNVAVVDVGWRGTSVLYLKKLLEREYELDVNVHGALVGVNRGDYTEGMLECGILNSYIFSPLHHVDVARKIDARPENIFAMEMLFSSITPTLLKFDLDEQGNTKFVFKESNETQDEIMQIQEGIQDFVTLYMKQTGVYGNQYNISAMNAIAPFMVAIENRKYINSLTEKCQKQSNARHGLDNVNCKEGE